MNKEAVIDLINWWGESEYTLHDSLTQPYADKVCKLVSDAIYQVAEDLKVQIEDLSDLDALYGANHLDATHIGSEGNPCFYYKAKSGNIYCYNDKGHTWDICHFDSDYGLIPVKFKDVL